MLSAPPPTDSKKADTDTAALAALKCAYALMQQRIISSPNDMMGVLLYGTENSKFQEDEPARGGVAYPHCYLLADLDVPAAEDVKTLKTLVEDEGEFQKLIIPSKEPISMANVLFCANQIFTTKAPNFSSRRLFIVTDNDDPHANDKAMKSSSAVRAKDLYDLGVIIELFPISRPDQKFDRGKFYDDIIYNPMPSDPAAPMPMTGVPEVSAAGDGISLLQSLLSSINSRNFAKRTLFSNLPFEIGPGFIISVKGYILLKRQEKKRSCYVWLGGEKPLIASGVTNQVADDSGRALEKIEIKKAFKFGGAQVTFTPEEVGALRHFGDPGLRIIGFKPLSLLPFWANLKHNTFIYPSEDVYIGSTRVFAALQQKLLKDQKMGIAWYVARKNAAPQIAAVVAGAEKTDDKGEQAIPPGMWIIPIPFADDVRQNPETRVVRAPDRLTDLMREVVQLLQLPKAVYDPSKYPNPALQWHYRILQAMALDEDLPEKPEDKTTPKYRQIDKRVGPLMMDWGYELERQYKEMGSDATGLIPSKRSAGGQDDIAVRGKKAKTDANDDTIDDASMRKAFDDNTINKLTVPLLKSWLQSKGMAVSGKKSDLVDRVEGYYEQK